jgi:hypothetical protein
VHELDVRAAAHGRLDPGDAERSLVVLGEEDAAAANVVERVRHSSSHVSRSSTNGNGTSCSNSSQSSWSTGSSASVAAPDRHPAATRTSGREQVVRREVLERVEARAELVHIDTVEQRGRLAERKVADGPCACGRAR